MIKAEYGRECAGVGAAVSGAVRCRSILNLQSGGRRPEKLYHAEEDQRGPARGSAGTDEALEPGRGQGPQGAGAL